MRALLPLLLAAAAAAHAPVPSATRQAFLQVNGYYVLYTYPTGPHLSHRGTLLAPLPVTLELLGAHVDMSPDATSASVRFLGSDYSFTAGSSTFLYNNRRLPLPEPPQPIPGRGLLVPLLPVLAARGVPHQWHFRWRVLRIWDWRLNTQANPLWHTFMWDRAPADRLPRDRLTQFVPVRFHASWSSGFIDYPPSTGSRVYVYKRRFYTEVQHTAGLTLSHEERVFLWDAWLLLVKSGEDFLTAWSRRGERVGKYHVRGGLFSWGDYIPPPGHRLQDPCTSRPGGRYVCDYVSGPALGLPGWESLTAFVIAAFVRE
jgi:hypothetical protein